MSADLTIGIDPGMSGGWCCIWGNNEPVLYSFDGYDSATSEFRQYAFHNGRIKVYLENATGNLNIDGKMRFAPKLARNLGWWEGLCMGLGYGCTLVHPKDWQKGLTGLQGLKGAERKRRLREIACQQHPQLKVTLKNCDALLIAKWGAKQ